MWCEGNSSAYPCACSICNFSQSIFDRNCQRHRSLLYNNTVVRCHWNTGNSLVPKRSVWPHAREECKEADVYDFDFLLRNAVSLAHALIRRSMNYESLRVAFHFFIHPLFLFCRTLSSWAATQCHYFSSWWHGAWRYKCVSSNERTRAMKRVVHRRWWTQTTRMRRRRRGRQW